ncbi:hypothetical protein [Agromyces badenianii]|uniref:hypothetical protein n=1 Tax=Agromyces badenianii TaxID=2080742 RepID=UPI000D591D10|nr:hypothetical protein [Agromyces badenianii]PWC03734.1 hypothetical protein DCE94_12130 [Agromyces badenianii]
MAITIGIGAVAIVAGGMSAPSASADDGQGWATMPIAIHKEPGVGPTPMVTIIVGGSPVQVNLDTGSNGLVLAPGVVVDDWTPRGERASQDYVSAVIEGELGVADVTFGTNTLSGVTFLKGDTIDCTSPSTPCPSHWPLHGAAGGVLGIGQAPGSEWNDKIESPFMYATGEAAAGFLLDIPTDAGGILTIGGVVPAPDGIAVNQVPSGGQHPLYPNGQTRYDKAPAVCWTVGTVSACHDTSFDTDEPQGTVYDDAFDCAQYPHGRFSAGLPVTMAASMGATPFASFITTDDPPDTLHCSAVPDNNGHFNTGFAFFIGKTVGFDSVGGRIIMQAVLAPAVPTPSVDPSGAAAASPKLAESGSSEVLLVGGVSTALAVVVLGAALMVLPRRDPSVRRAS